MRTRSRLAALAATLLAAIAVGGCGDGQPDLADLGCHTSADCVVVSLGQPIALATLLNSSDPVATDSLRAAQMAIDYLDGAYDGNDGTLLGHPVTLANAEEDCTPRGGIAGAKRLVLDPNLVAVLGTTCSAAAYDAAATVLSQRAILMVSPSNTSPKLTDPETHERFYFRTAFNDLVQGAVVADFAATRLHARRAAAIYTNDAYSRVLAESFGRALSPAGGTLVASASTSVGGSPAAAVRTVARAKPDVVFIPVFQPPCVAVVRAVRAEPALQGVPVVVSEACQSREVLHALGGAANGVYSSGPDYGDFTGSAFYADSFLPAYRERFGEAPLSPFHATAYDATTLIFSAIRRATTVLPGQRLVINRAKLREAMINTQGYAGISGPLACLPTGDCDPSTRIAVYRAPAWPQANAHAKPVYSEGKSLADVIGGG
jgi:branched-chain amino acid transport system substrate-binding protein